MASDRIRLSRVLLCGCHGVTEAERQVARPFEVDVELTTDLAAAADSDDLTATVDYARVYEIVRRVHEAGPYRLLEALAGRIAKEVAHELGVAEVTVRVRKPNPPVGGVVGAAEVEITRGSEQS